MAFRTGFLFIAQIDETTTSSLLSLLRGRQLPIVVIHETGVGSQRNWIEETLRRWSDEDELDLIVTIGGTMPAPGPSQLQCIPEATSAVLDRKLPGFSELMRAHARKQTRLAMLDRGVCGIRGRTLILNLPKGAAAALLFLEAVVDLIVPTIACLQEDGDFPEIEDELELTHEEVSGKSIVKDEDSSRHNKLDADEFAKFLQRNQKKSE